MKEFMMPDFGKLSKKDRNELLDIFEKFGKTTMSSLLNQIKTKNKTRMEIDGAFLRLLGMHKKEISIFLDGLYSILGREFDKLQGIISE